VKARGFGLRAVPVAVGIVLATVACRQDMHDQPRYKTYAPSDLFEDGRSARPLVEGTVARGQLREDELLYTGRSAGVFAGAFPLAVNEATLRRGRARYEIFCVPCHGLTGEGDGMVVRRGYKKPPPLSAERFSTLPPGYLFDVVTRGFGAMPDYAWQIAPEDRWAIVAYLRALQLSQRATLADLPESERQRLLSKGALP
jgi:mono/diheme cytochrome c family protein